MASLPASLVYRVDDIELDTAKGSLRRAGQEIHLKPKAFQILVYLLAERDRLVSKEELMEQFWKGTTVSDDVLAHSIAEVRRALGDSSRDPQYVKTVPKRGYRFVGNVQEFSTEALVATEQVTTIEVREEYSDEDSAAMRSRLETVSPALAPSQRRLPQRRVATVSALTAFCIMTVLAIWHYWPWPPSKAVDLEIRTAIIPFENRSGRPDLEWLRAGLADMLATNLSASPRIGLITPRQLERGFRESTAAPIRYEDALRAARQSGARAMIMGAYASLGESIRLDAQIYDVSSGRLLGGEILTVQKPDLLLAQLDSLSSKLAARLGAPIIAQTRLAEVMTNNLEAYRLYSLGLERTRNLRPAEAIELYQKAAALDSAFAMAYARIGFTYAQTWDRPAEGKPYLEQAYRQSDRLTPRDRLFIRAWYAIACQDYSGAERAYREILSAFPLEVEAFYALGTLLEHDRRHDEARQIFERGLAVDPNMPQLYNQLAGVYFEVGQNQRAFESVRRYVALSGEPNAYDSLGLAYYRVGQYDSARDTFLEAIHRKPDFELAFIHLGNLYFQVGRYRESLDEFREYIRLAPSNVERFRGHLASSWVYWKKGDLANAEREAGEAARVNGHDVRETLPIRADRGGLALTDDLKQWILSGWSSRGGRGFQRIPEFIVGYVALRDHKTEEALAHFRAAIREAPVYWFIDPLETCLADALLELGRLDEAIAEYRRVLRLNPNYPMARYRLALALERKGMSRDARAEFEQFLKIWKNADPDVPEMADARRQYERVIAMPVLKR